MSDPGVASWLVGALAVGWSAVVSLVTGWSIVGALTGPDAWLERSRAGACEGHRVTSRCGSAVVLRVGVGGVAGLWTGSMVLLGVRFLGLAPGDADVVLMCLDVVVMVLAVLTAHRRGALGVGLDLGKTGWISLGAGLLRASMGVWLLRVALLSGWVMTLFHAVSGYLKGPFGAFDAISIWNTKARFLANSALWERVFSPQIEWTHPDYPLLLPLNVARLWSYTSLSGQGTPEWCGLVLGLAYLGLGLMIVGATACWLAARVGEFTGSSEGMGETLGLVAALAVVGSTGVQSSVLSQMADLPVGVALVAAVACSIRAVYEAQSAEKSELVQQRRVSWAGLAGLMAGAAAWTKNEGLLMAMAVGFGLGMAVVLWPTLAKRSGDKAISRQGLWMVLTFVGAFMPTGLVLLGVKLGLAPANDLFSEQSVSGLGRLFDPVRHLQIIMGMMFAVKDALGWPLLLAGMVALVIVLGSPRRLASPSPLIAGMIATILAGEYAVYLLTPHDLVWHLQTSADRLIVQLWPTVVLGLTGAVGQFLHWNDLDAAAVSPGAAPRENCTAHAAVGAG